MLLVAIMLTSWMHAMFVAPLVVLALTAAVNELRLVFVAAAALLATIC